MKRKAKESINWSKSRLQSYYGGQKKILCKIIADNEDFISTIIIINDILAKNSFYSSIQKITNPALFLWQEAFNIVHS